MEARALVQVQKSVPFGQSLKVKQIPTPPASHAIEVDLGEEGHRKDMDGKIGDSWEERGQ